MTVPLSDMIGLQLGVITWVQPMRLDEKCEIRGTKCTETSVYASQHFILSSLVALSLSLPQTQLVLVLLPSQDESHAREPSQLAWLDLVTLDLLKGHVVD